MEMILKGREQNCSLNRCILSEIDYPVWGKQNAYLFDGSSSFRAKNVEYMRSVRLSSKLHRTRLCWSPNIVFVRIDRSEATPLVRRASQVIRVCSCSPYNGGCGISGRIRMVSYTGHESTAQQKVLGDVWPCYVSSARGDRSTNSIL